MAYENPRGDIAKLEAALAEQRRENERLTKIVLYHQAEQKKLELKNDRLSVEFAERGKINARLNKENDRLRKALGIKENPGNVDSAFLSTDYNATKKTRM